MEVNLPKVRNNILEQINPYLERVSMENREQESVVVFLQLFYTVSFFTRCLLLNVSYAKVLADVKF